MELSKKIEPFRTTAHAAFYKVSKPDDISSELLRSAAWPEELRMVCFEFKTVKLQPPVPLSVKLPSKYSVSLACYSSGRAIKAAQVPACGIEIRSPRNIAELKKATRNDEVEFISRYGSKLSAAAKAGYSILTSKELCKIKCVIAFKNGRQVGFFGHLPHKGVSGKTYDSLISWNTFRGLSAAERRSAFAQAFAWLKKSARSPISIVAGAYEKDLRKALSEAGFTTCRVCVERTDGAKK